MRDPVQNLTKVKRAVSMAQVVEHIPSKWEALNSSLRRKRGRERRRERKGGREEGRKEGKKEGRKEKERKEKGGREEKCRRYNSTKRKIANT
jgi:hypothetical protein